MVRVDPEQKTEMIIGDSLLLSGSRYSDNWREKTPVVAEIIQGFGIYTPGMSIICSYTHFGEDSYYSLYDDHYSIPIDEFIFAIIQENGSLMPVNGNIFVEREYAISFIEKHDDYKKPLKNRGRILNDGEGFKQGDQVFWLNYADYEIVYNWLNSEYRAIKVEKQEIVGVILS
jgi:hypothetical protein